MTIVEIIDLVFFELQHLLQLVHLSFEVGLLHLVLVPQVNHFLFNHLLFDLEFEVLLFLGFFDLLLKEFDFIYEMCTMIKYLSVAPVDGHPSLVGIAVV